LILSGRARRRTAAAAKQTWLDCRPVQTLIAKLHSTSQRAIREPSVALAISGNHLRRGP